MPVERICFILPLLSPSLPHPLSLSPSPTLIPSLPPSLFSSSLQIVCHGKTVEEVTRHLGSLAPPFLTFRDASCGPPSYPLTLYHCFSAVYKVQTIPHGRKMFVLSSMCVPADKSSQETVANRLRVLSVLLCDIHSSLSAFVCVRSSSTAYT